MNRTAVPFCVCKALSVVATIFALAGCVGGGPIQPHPPVRVDTGALQTHLYPEIGTEAVAELGQTLVARRFVKNVPTIELASPVSITTSHNGIPLSIHVPSGKLTKWGTGETGVYYAIPGFTATARSLGKDLLVNTFGGFVVPDGGSEAKYVFRKADSNSYVFLADIVPPIAIRSVADTVESHKDSFVRELIYTGVSKNVITIVYREFSNDLVRPAFTQELKYDLGEGDVIGYKGARFQVIKATNTGITYKVLRNLD